MQNNNYKGVDNDIDIQDPTLAQDIIYRWKKDPALRKEFGSLGAYAAFREAEARGIVKIYGCGSFQGGVGQPGVGELRNSVRF